MIEADTLKKIGRKLRLVYEEEPKGGIPDHLWQLFLDLEWAEIKAKSTADQGSV